MLSEINIYIYMKFMEEEEGAAKTRGGQNSRRGKRRKRKQDRKSAKWNERGERGGFNDRLRHSGGRPEISLRASSHCARD